jgi:hypothetical protein
MRLENFNTRGLLVLVQGAASRRLRRRAPTLGSPGHPQDPTPHGDHHFISIFLYKKHRAAGPAGVVTLVRFAPQYVRTVQVAGRDPML